MTAQTLTLKIEREADRLSGSAALSNHGGAAIKIWQLGSQWGDYNLSFQINGETGTIQFVKRPQIYTVNVPVSVALQPGDSEIWPFDLSDGSWQSNSDAEVNTAKNLTAIFEIEETQASKELGIWTGHITSAQ